MKVAVLCECSGIVRNAFLECGHDAISCDIKDTELPGPHRKGDIFSFDWSEYDLIIAHPPCTYLCSTGNPWFSPKYKRTTPAKIKKRLALRIEAFNFFIKIINMKNPKIAIENPQGIISTWYKQPDQIIHPYYFGDEFQKRTCLWLKNLPNLVHYKYPELFHRQTHVDKGKINVFSSGKKKPAWMDKGTKKDRQTNRSRTFPGIAKAMSSQWGQLDF